MAPRWPVFGLLALTAAQAKKVSYIEELDERLAVEQATREEQARLLAQLQQSLSERTAKEAASAARALLPLSRSEMGARAAFSLQRWNRSVQRCK